MLGTTSLPANKKALHTLSRIMLSLACDLGGDGSYFAKQIAVVSAAVGLTLVQLPCIHVRHGLSTHLIALASVS